MCISVSGVVLVGLYQMIFGQFYPNMQGKLGHDFSLFLPKLLDGYYWYRANGLCAVPWFTPAFCGGIPLFPDPQSIYYSVPQFLTFLTNPLTSIALTVWLFAGLGFVGCYLLLRQVFCTTPWSALLGAGLFLFNGFYAHHMIVGHLTYHPFMLTPALALFLLRAHPASASPRRDLACDVVLAGLLMAYMFQAGMVNVILPVLASIIAIGLLQRLIQRQSTLFYRRLLLAGGIALALCSAKLVAALAYLQHFGRDTYRLPGLHSVVDTIQLVLRSLFIGSEAAFELFPGSFVNLQWLLELHEFEFGVTVIPLLFLVAGGVHLCHTALRTQQLPWHGTDWLRVGVLSALLLLPILVNYYTPQWNALLKQLPILKNSSLLLRWISLYIPVVILLAAVCCDRIVRPRLYQPGLVLLSLAVVVWLNSTANRGYYHAQPYDPRTILQAYERVQHRQWTPAISHMVVFTDEQGREITTTARNDVLTEGYSQILCYEPLFGYRLEAFPRQTLSANPVLHVTQGRFNLKNPACYVFPTANRCTPGEHFSVQEQAAMTAFTTYQPFLFRLPVWQKIANILNLVAGVAVLGFLSVVLMQRCWWRHRGAPPIPPQHVHGIPETRQQAPKAASTVEARRV
jgi:hypothetical protein